ncbi:MAG TPA: cation transporter [Candidatus Onthovivens sp.]|nr:cation transporter [Candidatus Onthovivens sp.]
MEIVYKFSGIDCANCARKIEKKIKKIDNVSEVTLNFLSSKIFITVDNEALLEPIKKRIKDLSYTLEIKRIK